MNGTVQLVGLDFGTTTSSAVIAEANLTRNSLTGRTDLDQVRERFRSDMIFTPMCGEQIDEAAVASHLDRWLQAGGMRPADVFGGGALLTGLTAQRGNAAALVRLIRLRLGDALIARADDPCLESWLAFMGSCAELARNHPDIHILNLDIGGGTTNLALGQAGEVLRTGCLFVGARHVQVEPGTYRIVRLSHYARALLEHLGICKGIGDELDDAEVDAILGFFMSLLEAAVSGDRAHFDEPTARLHQQVPFHWRAESRERAVGVIGLLMGPDSPFAVTISGGVGELVYSYLDGKPWPSTTAFGDLGIDLARRLVASRWADDLKRYRPASAGRATVYGLLRHSTEISGSTLYLPNPQILPLADLPIVGSISPVSSDDDLRELLGLAARSECGACLRVHVGSHAGAAVRGIGMRIARAIREGAFPRERPLILLVKENLGKVLGQIVTSWGTLPIQLVVVDEVPDRNAQFARIGRPRQQVVPVSFYGMA